MSKGGADAGMDRKPAAREQLAGTMFDIQDPPTGPAKMPTAPNSFRGYLHWRQTAEGRTAWTAIERAAWREYESGAKRISVNRLVEEVRITLQLEVNNTYRAWIADDLCRRYPDLLDVIERRKRTKAE